MQGLFFLSPLIPDPEDLLRYLDLTTHHTNSISKARDMAALLQVYYMLIQANKFAPAVEQRRLITSKITLLL